MSLRTHELQRFWAKTTPDAVLRPRAYHPLLCHMIDVGAMTGEMWRRVISPAWRARIANELGWREDDAASIIAWLAGLHDLGKASPPFALRTDSPSARRLRETFRGTLFDSSGTAAQAGQAPHGIVTAYALAGVPQTEPGILPGEYGLNAPLARQIAAAIGGHHGTFPRPNDTKKMFDPRLCGNRAWANARHELAIVLGALFGVPRLLPATHNLKLSDGATMLLSGLVSVADWIGSDTRFFECEIEDADTPTEIDFDDYFVRAQEQARRALRQLGWLARPDTSRARISFAQMFPHVGESLRPLQQVARDVADSLRAPGIAIIEAPMGEGKTEAAMYIADAWTQVIQTRGYYFALPTQATSNQMFRRVRDFLRARYGDDESVTLQLLHGHAALSAEFADLLRAGNDALAIKETLAPQSVFDDDDRTRNVERRSSSSLHDDERGSVIAAEWFTHRKRGLLAAFGVGTIDQVLLAALQTPHVFVRLFGLAGKVVIIDEVHAYDAYMSELLERLLEWLAALRSPVVLLSATLPRERTQALLAAYVRGGKSSTPDDADDADAPRATTHDTAKGVHLADYPRITWATTATDDERDDSTTDSRSFDTSEQAKRTLHLRATEELRTDDNDELQLDELISDLKQALVNGGCGAVICNTVARAQAVYEALQSSFPGRAFDDEDVADDAPPLDLLHARFTYDERMNRERRTLRRFGKQGAEIAYEDGTTHVVRRPHHAVLVATQIVEQSLDLDFDLMITELAPADLMLQRAGRLHRHVRPRPAKLEDPTLWIIEPRIDADGTPDFERSKFVYDEHILLRSWLEMRARFASDTPSIEIPGHVESLVEKVYGDTLACPDPALQTTWTRTLDERRQRLADERREAQDRWLARPGADIPLWRFTASPREEDDPEAHPAHQALTRLTEPSVQVACLYEDDIKRVFLDQDFREHISLKAAPSLATTKKILYRSITISGYRAALPLMHTDVPQGWQKSALLRHVRVLRLNSSNEARVGSMLYRLDPRLGLMTEKLKGESS